jgi:hypothetical protein
LPTIFVKAYVMAAKEFEAALPQKRSGEGRWWRECCCYLQRPEEGPDAAGEKIMASAQSSMQEAVSEELIGERRLWTAVVVMAVEDWRNGTLRSRRDAQRFLFENDKDFEMVCASAGLEPGCLRAKLLKLGARVEMKNTWRDAVRERLAA